MDLSRRRFLAFTGLGAAAAATGGLSLAGKGDSSATDHLAATFKFDGPFQAGIATPAQDRLHFASFDLITDDRAEVSAMLKRWTDASRRMVRGEDAGEFGAVGGPRSAPPDDTGEALGLLASGLTITIGYGASLFEKDGVDRFRLKDRRPAGLIDLPPFRGDALDPATSGGDIAIQACANDPQVAVHAVRNLARLAHGTATVRWSQLGFGRTSSTSTAQATPRNLFGFKDGTANLKAEDPALLRDHVWVAPEDETGESAWMVGGTYMVARRIRMQIETWDRAPLAEQEEIVGRNKGEGAPIGAEKEFDTVDLEATDAAGDPLIAQNSHVRLAHPNSNGGAQLLRRGYSFVDGSDGLGRLDAGLFFIAYQRNLREQFVAIQTNLARNDTMNEYVKHTGSATFACPPGLTSAGDHWGKALFT